jgi:predicted nucleic acid-binding protein
VTAGQNRWVMDASVGIKLFVPETHSEQAQALFDHSDATSPHAVVPDLFYVECANILWKYVRRFGYPVLEAGKNMTALKKLGLRTVPSSSLMERALELALKWEVTAYDACYLALAEELKAPLVTADQKLFNRLKGGSIPMRWIGELSKRKL